MILLSDQSQRAIFDSSRDSRGSAGPWPQVSGPLPGEQQRPVQYPPLSGSPAPDGKFRHFFLSIRP